MIHRNVLSLALVACLCVAPASLAALSAFSEDFEALDPANPDALGNTGWLVFGNVFDDVTGAFLFGYGPFPAPNDGAAFSAVVVGEGGPEQGAQQLSVFSDYNCCEPSEGHFVGNLVESNVFREQTVGPDDVGTTWTFAFSHKRGNIEGGTTAAAFIKTLDPDAGFALTNFLTVDMTSIPDTWGGDSISIFIDAELEGQILQFGFLNTATNFEGSGIFYDNVTFGVAAAGPTLSATGTCPGSVTVTADGLTPDGALAIGWSLIQGESQVPSGGCAGTPLGLASPQLLTLGTADASGSFSIDANAPAQACGAVLQAIDLATCDTTNVAFVP